MQGGGEGHGSRVIDGVGGGIGSVDNRREIALAGGVDEQREHGGRERGGHGWAAAEASPPFCSPWYQGLA